MEALKQFNELPVAGKVIATLLFLIIISSLYISVA